MANVYVIGGPGTGADANASNGGGWTAGYDATYANTMGANGGPIVALTGCNGTASSAVTRISKNHVGEFANVKTGQLVYMHSVTEPAKEGVLRVTAVDASGNWFDTTLPYDKDRNDFEVRVGGALDTIGTAKSLPAAGDMLLLAGERTYTLAASWVPTTGTATSIIVTKGVNKLDGSDITDPTKRPVVRPSADLVGMLELQDASDYNHFYDIILDGDDGGGNTGDYAVYNNASSAYVYNIQFCGCDFKNCDADGVYWNGRSAALVFMNCNNIDNGAMGFNFVYTLLNLVIDGCSILRNGTVGLYFHNDFTYVYAANICNNLIADNGTYGIQVYRRCLTNVIKNNTIINNGSDGIYIAYGTAALTAAQADNILANNIIAYNGGYGVNAHANVTAQLYAEQIVRNNYFYGNKSGAWPSAINQFFAHVSNVTNVDPLFMDRSNATVALRDYRLQCTSTILHAGFQGTVVGYGALNTIDFPAAASVLETDTVNGSAGTLAADDVLTTAGGDYVGPATTDVKDGVFYGPDSNYEGEYVGGGGGGGLLQGNKRGNKQ